MTKADSFTTTFTVCAFGIAPNNKTDVQKCLDAYANSPQGKATKFLSLYNLYQERGSLKTWAEWTVLPYIKVQALNITAKFSQLMSNVEFLSTVSPGAGTIVQAPLAAGIEAAEPIAAAAAPYAIGVATINDILQTAACQNPNPTTLTGH
jgi:hypothetical protein